MISYDYQLLNQINDVNEGATIYTEQYDSFKYNKVSCGETICLPLPIAVLIGAYLWHSHQVIATSSSHNTDQWVLFPAQGFK